MDKILITGGSGFIGRHLILNLLQNGYTVASVDLNLWDHSELKFAYEMDICSPSLRHIFQEFEPTYVIHLAAQSNVSQSISKPLVDASTNILGTVNVLEQCKNFGVKKIIYSSTAAVYGNPVRLPISEDADKLPQSQYGISKYTAERYIQHYYSLYQLEYTILRFSNVYGPGQNSDVESGVVSNFIKKMSNHISPIIYGDGEQTRDFIYVKDIAEAIRLVIAEEVSEVLNLSTGRETSINELFTIIKSCMGFSGDPHYVEAKKEDIRQSCLANNKFLSKSSWVPKTPLFHGINETVMNLIGIEKAK